MVFRVPWALRGPGPPNGAADLVQPDASPSPNDGGRPVQPPGGQSSADVFAREENLLLEHLQLNRAVLGRLLYNCTSLGDRTPTAMLQYMRTLQPGEEEGVLFRHIFVHLLPDVVREVVSSIDSLDEMAATATTVYQSNAAASISALSLVDAGVVGQVNAVRRQQRSGGPRPSSGRNNSGSGGRQRGGVVLCKTHSRYGRDTYRCDRPDSCPMHDILKAPPAGNGPAGRN